MLDRSRLRPLTLSACLVAVAAGSLTAATSASAVTSSTAVATADYATELFGDPWDFSNPEDVLLDGGLTVEEGGPTVGMRDAEVRGGQLTWSMTNAGYFSPVWGGYPGALYLGREAGAPERQVDASRFTRLSFHLFASEPTVSGVQWFGCEGLDPACWGGQPFLVRQGWNTYDITLKNQGYGLPQEWEGMITGLRLALSPSSSTSFALDWMRLYEPGTTTSVLRGGQWDVNDTTSDNVAHRPGWGNVNCVAGPCDIGFLPPGAYHLRNTLTDAFNASIRLLRPARPVVLDPDEVGGLDHAASDPWDFDAVTDVGLVANAEVLRIGPRLEARNTGPFINDPHVWLPLREPLIPSYRFHRFTIRSGYEGPFDLRDEVGGGTMGRVVWQHVDDPNHVQQTADMVTYGGTRTLTVDLSRPDIHETDDDAGVDRLWTASDVSGIRWDPNEDRGPRRWWVERAALRADDEAGTSFDVRWYDAGYAPGSTVRLYASTDEKGSGRRAISGPIAQRPGTNSYRWDVSGVQEGRYWVEVEVSGAAGTAVGLSTGPVRVTRTIASGQMPSPAVPLTRDLIDACPQSRVPGSGVRDVSPRALHAPSIDCIAWWGVTAASGGSYDPTAPVSRGQMATFLRRVVERTGGPLAAGRNAFPDDDGNVHEAAINALAAAGLVGGYADGLYRPNEGVTRAQMATFLTRAAERVAGPLPRTADFFTDDNGGTHEAGIDKAAGSGLAGGTADGRYSPEPQVRRDQMASFLARTLDLLVHAGYGAPPPR